MTKDKPQRIISAEAKEALYGSVCCDSIATKNKETLKQAMERTCDTCLFYVDSMPHLVICIAGKRIKEYLQMKTNCKKWVENTPENAKKQLELIKQSMEE